MGEQVWDASDYLTIRAHLLLADVCTRRRRLAEAFAEADVVIQIAREFNRTPAGGFGAYCVVLLLLAAGLHHSPPEAEPPVLHRTWNQAVVYILDAAAEFAAKFLGPQREAFYCWVRCWF